MFVPYGRLDYSTKYFSILLDSSFNICDPNNIHDTIQIICEPGMDKTIFSL